MHAFRVAYDGRPFHGFQRQPDVPTVEDAIFDALRALDAFDGEKPPGYAAAGRTDAGVSAVAQTVAFECPDWLTPAALNSELPAAVRAWASADAPDAFHATHHAASRTYTYHCYAPDADLGRARDALDALCGQNDFHNLTPDDRNTVRTLDGEVVEDGVFGSGTTEGSSGEQSESDGGYLVFTLTAGGFVRELVRRIVSLVRAVATGDAPAEKVTRVLDAEPLSGPDGVPPAPASPLVLTDVRYPDLLFSVDEAAVESARAVFEKRRVERETGARVAREIVDGLR